MNNVEREEIHRGRSINVVRHELVVAPTLKGSVNLELIVYDFVMDEVEGKGICYCVALYRGDIRLTSQALDVRYP